MLLPRMMLNWAAALKTLSSSGIMLWGEPRMEPKDFQMESYLDWTCRWSTNKKTLKRSRSPQNLEFSCIWEPIPSVQVIALRMAYRLTFFFDSSVIAYWICSALVYLILKSVCDPKNSLSISVTSYINLFIVPSREVVIIP